jgi:hypothetical protein
MYSYVSTLYLVSQISEINFVPQRSLVRLLWYDFHHEIKIL